MVSNDQPIGIFDSGVGGLTVAAAICEKLPQENIVYLGDTARLPYGTKSPETVQRYALNTTQFLLEQNVKALVIACNTASAVALQLLQEKAPVPVLGVIEPGALAAVGTGKKNIGVIGTEGTIASHAYQNAIVRIDQQAEIFAKPCPLFVPLAEENLGDHQATELLAHMYLDAMVNQQVEALVLGCTHYPILRGVIEKVMGPQTEIVDSATTTALALDAILIEKGLKTEATGEGSRHFYATDISPRFQEIARLFFGKGFTCLEHIDLHAVS